MNDGIDALGALRNQPQGRWLQRTASAVLWAMLSLAIYTAAVPIWFYMNHWQVVTLVSGSMAPTYPTGSNLIMESASDRATIGVGTVITVDEGLGLPVTHRVVERVVLPSGVAYRMKGDANTDPDPILIRSDQVIGTITRAAPWWSQVALWVEQTNLRIVVFGLPLSWLVAIEAATWLRQWRERADEAQSRGHARSDSDSGGGAHAAGT